MSNTTSTPSTMETSEGRVVYSVKEISQFLHTNAALIYRFIELGLSACYQARLFAGTQAGTRPVSGRL